MYKEGDSLKSITEEYQKVCFMYPKKEKQNGRKKEKIKKKKQRQARCDRINIQVANRPSAKG
jgi:hypothetical protein